MEKSTSQKLKLGIFVILSTSLLLIAVYVLGNRQSLFGGTFELHAVFKNTNGLQPGNNVRFSGINVGTVKDIEMQNDTTIIVNMLIEDKMKSHIHKNAVAAIGSDGLVGSMIVNITPGIGTAATVSPGDEIRAYSRIASEDMLSTLSVTNENAALITADLLKVTQSVINGKGTVGRLLNDTAMARDMQQAMANLKLLSEEVTMAVYDLRILISQVQFDGSPAQVLLSDSATGQKLKSLITDLENSGREINAVTGKLNSVVSQIQQGDGALHYLASDTVVVNRLDSTIQNIQEGTARFNENMEALKHNFLFRGYFKKQEKKAEKSELRE